MQLHIQSQQYLSTEAKSTVLYPEVNDLKHECIFLVVMFSLCFPYCPLQFLLADMKDVLESLSSVHSYQGEGSKKLASV